MYEIGDWGNEGCTLAADEGVPASRDVEKMKGIPTVTDSSFVLVTVSLSLSLSPALLMHLNMTAKSVFIYGKATIIIRKKRERVYDGDESSCVSVFITSLYRYDFVCDFSGGRFTYLCVYM